MLETAEDQETLDRLGWLANLQCAARLSPAHRLAQQHGEATRVHEIDRGQIHHDTLFGWHVVERCAQLVGRADVELTADRGQGHGTVTRDLNM